MIHKSTLYQMASPGLVTWLVILPSPFRMMRMRMPRFILRSVRDLEILKSIPWADKKLIRQYKYKYNVLFRIRCNMLRVRTFYMWNCKFKASDMYCIIDDIDFKLIKRAMHISTGRHMDGCLDSRLKWLQCVCPDGCKWEMCCNTSQSFCHAI